MDHGPMFMSINVGLWAGAIYILSHFNAPTPIFSGMSLATENLMGIVQFLGTSGVIFGQLSGTKLLMRGMDLRDSYNIVKWACVAVMVAFGVLIVATIVTGVIHPPWSEVMLLAFGAEVGYFLVATELNFEVKRLTRDLNRRIELMMR